MLIIGHACSTQLGLILTTGLLISSPLAASWDKSLAGVSAWYIWYFPLDFKRAFEYDFHSFLWRECCFPCTFCLSDHVHAIVLINQRLFFFLKCFWSCAVSIFSGSCTVLAHPCYLIFILTALVVCLPQRYWRDAATAAHPSVCLSAAENEWVDTVSQTQTRRHTNSICNPQLVQIECVQYMRGTHTHTHRCWRSGTYLVEQHFNLPMHSFEPSNLSKQYLFSKPLFNLPHSVSQYLIEAIYLSSNHGVSWE